MDRADVSRIREQFERLLRERLPGAPIARVAVLQHEDDPEIDPGDLVGRVYIEAPPDQEERVRFFEAFRVQHHPAILELRQELDRLPGAGKLEFVLGDEDDRRLFIKLSRPRGAPEMAGAPLVPVMARLGLAEIEIVDTLIGAGMAGNRAEAIRWALARISEHPAYEEIRRGAR